VYAELYSCSFTIVHLVYRSVGLLFAVWLLVRVAFRKMLSEVCIYRLGDSEGERCTWVLLVAQVFEVITQDGPRTESGQSVFE
jgi:hypothetical protein